MAFFRIRMKRENCYYHIETVIMILILQGTGHIVHRVKRTIPRFRPNSEIIRNFRKS